MQDLVQWQIYDSENGLVMPWFVHPFLDELHAWDLKDKVVLEFGGGWSTIWWASKAKKVFTIEANWGWAAEICQELSCRNIENAEVICRQVNEGDQSRVEEYTAIPEGCEPDIVVIDGILRHECLLKALTLKRPLIIIHDNWQQDGFVCPASEEVMKDFEIHNFIQQDHTDNHGRKWATCYWELK